MAAYQPGDVIRDQYRIVDILGKGSVAITYQGINLATGSKVAIKVISLKQLDNWKQIELFQREAEVLAKLNHPAIPSYIDYFDLETETDKAFYIVQQLAPGKSLFQLVESGWRTTEAEVKKIARQILNILIYLHSLEPPVIHRDIKPSNLIRSDDGKIYLVDFGAVQNTYYNTLMQGSTVVGTYGYMPPEQFRGKALPATDLYSLGATILYLLTHRSPSELPQDTLKLDFRSSVNISESFADWLEKILDPDLEDRFASAEVAKDRLFKSNKVKHKKVFTCIGISVFCLALVWGFTVNKLFFFSRLGFYPTNICSDFTTLTGYLDNKGKADIYVGLRYAEMRPLLTCVIKSRMSQQNKKDAIDLLIDRGANVNKLDLDYYRRTALFHTFETKNLELFSLLISKGANINITDRVGETIFSFTAINANSSLDDIKLLINNGADVNQGNNTLLKITKFRGLESRQEVIQLLIDEGININAKDRDGTTLLLYITKERDTEYKQKLVRLLIEKNVNVNAQDRDGNSPLLNITKRKHNEYTTEIIQLLIDNNADVNAQNKDGDSPLISITKNLNTEYNKEIIQLLIEKGADINARNKDGDSPLLKAIYSTDKEVIQLLIDRGAEINAQDKYGNTPLIYAIHRKNKDIIQLLIDRGADINHKNNWNKTPLSIALVAFDKELTPLLINNGAKADFMLYDKMKRMHKEIDSFSEYQKIDAFLQQYENR